jgi:hypothetical protein
LAASESTPVNAGLSSAITAVAAQITAMNVEMIAFIFSPPLWF